VTTNVALLLVDLQQDFLADTRIKPASAELVDHVSELLEWFRGRGNAVVHVHTRVAADLSNAMPHWRQVGRAICIEGTPGADPPDCLRPIDGERIFKKRFFDAFEDPGLLQFLQDLEIDTLVVVGVHTHACIRTTVVSAYTNGFEVLLAVDSVGSYDPPHATLTCDWLNQRAAHCLSNSSIQEVLSKESIETKERQSIWLHRDPSDWNNVVHKVPLMDRDAVNLAIRGLNEKQPAWSREPIEQRRKKLQEWHTLLSTSRERWITCLVDFLGKPFRDAEGEINYALGLLENCHENLCESEHNADRIVYYRPLGTIGIITPWNNPFAMPISKLAPALAYGNAVAWKPALEGTSTALMLKQSLDDVGLGEWVELVTGDAEAGGALIQAPEIAAVSFTGSVEVGLEISRLCGKLMRPVQAELGGNNAAIVLADADLEQAAYELAGAMFSFAGQRCTAIRRLIVEQRVFDRFSQLLRSATISLKTGSPSDPATQVGPVISKQRQEYLLELVKAAARSGAQILTGGTVPQHCNPDGCWIEPTIVMGLPAGSAVLDRELFGPVVALQKAVDLDDALAEHNKGQYGLLGALFSQNEQAQRRFLERAEAGLLLLNEARPNFSLAGPFSGWKNSSFGPPEHGRWSRDFFTRAQAVYGS